MFRHRLGKVLQDEQTREDVWVGMVFALILFGVSVVAFALLFWVVWGAW